MCGRGRVGGREGGGRHSARGRGRGPISAEMHKHTTAAQPARPNMVDAAATEVSRVRDGHARGRGGRGRASNIFVLPDGLNDVSNQRLL